MSNNNFPNMAIDTSGIPKIVFCDEGVAGTTRLSLDHDVILGIDTWNLGQLNELLVIVPEGDQNWSAPQTSLVAEITSISSQNVEQFLKLFAAESPKIQLDQSIRRLALAENLSVQLSDLYALEALFIREFKPALGTAIGQTANRSVPIVEDIYFKADTPNDEFSVDLISGAVLDIFNGEVPNLGFVDNQRTFGSSEEEFDTPAYPVPNALRRPTVPLNAILIDDYDIDHPFVNRAWYTVSNDEKSLAIFALNEFDDVDTFASVIDVAGSHRLQLQPTSELQDDLYVYQALAPWSGDTFRVEIHQSNFGESVPRSKRAEVTAKQSMAYVTALLQTVARTADFDRLIQADPTLSIDLDRCSLLFSRIAKRPDLALACQQIHRSFASPQNNESLFSTLERCQTIEIVRKLTSVGIDEELPELAEINEKSSWADLQNSNEIVEALNIQMKIPTYPTMPPQIFRSGFLSKSISFREYPESRDELRLATPGRETTNFLGNLLSPSPDHDLNFEEDSGRASDQIARRIAQHTLRLQSLAVTFLSREEQVGVVSEATSVMGSSRSIRRIPKLEDNFEYLINKLRIAQSSI